MPIDYTIARPDPLQRAQQGLQLGQSIRGIRDKRAAQEQAAMQKAQYSIDLQETFANPNPNNMARLIAKYPGQKDAFKQSFDLLSAEQKKNEILQTGQVYTALLGGNTEIATDILNENILANENSGKDTSKLKNILSYIERDPKGAAGYAGLVLASVDEDFSKTFGALGEEERAAKIAPLKIKRENAEIVKLGEELNLKKAQTNKAIIEGKNLGIEGKKALLELEALKATGGKDPAKTFDQEEKLRKEYTNRTKSFVASQDAFSKIKASATDNSGAGDIALVTSFMKMLDPGSVVRETEFATAQDTAGLYGNLKNRLQKIQDGQFLTPKQRGDFERLANKYMRAAEGQEKTVKTNLGKVVKNYELNPENVFGVVEERPETEEAPTEQPTTRNVVVDF